MRLAKIVSFLKFVLDMGMGGPGMAKSRKDEPQMRSR